MIFRNRIGRRMAGGIAAAVTLAATGALALAPASANAAVALPLPPHTVYAVTFSANSALYTLNPWSHRETLVGNTGTELTDITFQGRALYAISFTDLYWLNPATGASHHIGSLGLSTANANALTTEPLTNTLYGADLTGDFFRINPWTGHTTLIGNFGHGLGSAGDLTFADGRLYATVSLNGSAETYLATVNVHTGAARIVGDTHNTDVFGLVSGAGALYGATDTGLFLAISPVTGRARTIWNEGLTVSGLATP
jgi:hypothetical protein